MLGFKSAWKDIQNYKEWVNVIKREHSNPDSPYNKFGFSHNYTYMIYLVITLAQDEGQLPDNIKKVKVIESLAPVNRYLDEELNFAEYLVPEFNQVFDEDNEPTLSYVIAYRFAFKTLGIWWSIKRLVLLTGLVWAGLEIYWTELFGWIFSLI